MEKLTNKVAAINIKENNNESKNIHKVEKGKIVDCTNDNMPCEVEILSRAAKATGKSKTSCNIEYAISMCNHRGHVNFHKVNDIAINAINTEEVVIIEDNCFEKAK